MFLSESSGYSMSSGAYWFGSWLYCPAMPVPFVSLFQIGLWMHCVWISSSVGSKANGSDPPSWPVYHIGGFPHISSPKSLCGNTHNPSLVSCHLKPALNYLLKLKSQLENPAYSCVFEPQNIQLFEDSPSKILPLSIHMLPHLKESKLNVKLIDDASFLDITPWMLSAHSPIWSE